MARTSKARTFSASRCSGDSAVTTNGRTSSYSERTNSRRVADAPQEIGQIGGGKHKPTGRIDVAMMQSLSQNGVVDDIVGNYGYVIVDECHHVSAASFERVVGQCKARYVTGLSATVARKDGHQPIIFMQCGPIRYRVDDRKQAEKRPFDHKVVVQHTHFRLPPHVPDAPALSIQDLYAMLVKDDQRNLTMSGWTRSSWLCPFPGAGP